MIRIVAWANLGFLLVVLVNALYASVDYEYLNVNVKIVHHKIKTKTKINKYVKNYFKPGAAQIKSVAKNGKRCRGKFISYIVKKGDTLYKISSKFKVRISVISRLNNIIDPNIIYVGQRLRIPCRL